MRNKHNTHLEIDSFFGNLVTIVKVLVDTPPPCYRIRFFLFFCEVVIIVSCVCCFSFLQRIELSPNRGEFTLTQTKALCWLVEPNRIILRQNKMWNCFSKTNPIRLNLCKIIETSKKVAIFIFVIVIRIGV